METVRQNSLNSTYAALIKVAFMEDPISKIDGYIDEKFMGYGTASDEKLYGVEGFRWMIERQREEVKGLSSKIKQNPVYRQIFSNDTSALFVEEIEIIMEDRNETNLIPMTVRVSTLLKYNGKKWMIIHFHGSTPDANTVEGSAWPIEEWKRKNAQLEVLVKEKTADLLNKNRELEIGTALERVRTGTMGMQRSDEFSNVLTVLFQQFDILGIDPLITYLMLFDEANNTFSFRMTGLSGRRGLVEQILDIDKIEAGKIAYLQWKNGEENTVNCIDYLPENLPLLWEVMAPVFDTLPEGSKMCIKDYPNGLFVTQGHCKFGYLGFIHSRRAAENEKAIVALFAAEFGRIYQRFLDLQKAEEQTGEARIEAALERVRSKAMAMHNSKDIETATAVMFNELTGLGIEMERCGICIFDETPIGEIWSTPLSPKNKEVVNIVTGLLDTNIHPLLQIFIKGWREKRDFTFYKLVGNEVQKYYNQLEKQPNYRFPKIASYPVQQIGYNFNFKEGSIFVFTIDELSVAVKQIFRKFAKVFEHTYTRFLDLQKAEAQVREAQIEAALERVRTKAMAMRNSKDIETATAVVFNELTRLGIEMERCGIGILNESSIAEIWSTPLSPQKKEVVKVITGLLDMNIHPLLQMYHKGWSDKKDITSYKLIGDEVQKYYDQLEKQPNYRFPKITSYPAQQIGYNFYFKEGGIFVFTLDELSVEATHIFRRFAKVFEQTYTRFLDLQKAEAQAKDAQIEAALERVRSKAMGMQNSSDLTDIAATVFKEYDNLGLKTIRCGLAILQENFTTGEVWTALDDEHGKTIKIMGHLPLDMHPMITNAFESWKRNEPLFFYLLEGDDLLNYYKALTKADYNLLENSEARAYLLQTPHYWTQVNLPVGLLFSFTEAPLSEEDLNLQKRFGAVFNMAYTRFEDIQKAEALARAAVRESSLDRVRAQIAAIRTTTDLQQITPLIWNELQTLGIPFIRCGVFIMDEENEIMHTYLSTPEGKAIAALHLPFSGVSMTEKILPHWRDQSIYEHHWDKKGFLNWSRELIAKGFIESENSYRVDLVPENLHLYFVPFLQGMLYVGNANPLPQESLNLIKSLADAFATAYARYDDFNKLEDAKEKIENAFTELQAAKDQLVQQEKLASLGQLTAGIAHEIKNPLNFINNFSDLNIELIDEVIRELVKEPGKNEEIKEILADVRSNLNKIYQHGERADSIVKSMLQHSRGSNGKMELTDLNAMIREYVNLAYHGMRAGKNPINVEIKIELDGSIKKIPLVAEDFSRVLLNVCSNGFDAMRTKSLYPTGTDKTNEQNKMQEYRPELKVSTSQQNGHVLIEIEDNGIGIPEAIQHKIFQPFFTTKKGTEGTGLGLSITNDIVKAHGGILEIETEEALFTRFRIKIDRKT